MRGALAPAALVVAALSPASGAPVGAGASHAAHAHAPTTIAAPRVGDLTVARLTVLTSGPGTPRLRFTTPTAHRPTVYGAVVATGPHRYVARVVVLRHRGDSAAPLRWSFGAGARSYLEWQVRDVLHQPGVAPGLLAAGADPRAVCSSFSTRFHHLAGAALAMSAGAFGTDACLLAAHALLPAPGFGRAAHVTVPAGFLSAYPKVSVAVQGTGTVVGPVAGIACGARCAGYVRAGHGGTLTALPASGWTFAGWTGACAGRGPCAVTGTTAFHAVARFAPSGASPSSTPVLPDRTGAQLYEFAVHLTHDTVAAGEVEIVAADNGQDDHQLAVRDANGTVLGQTALIHPGGEATLDVALAPGTYDVYCPTANHEALGMITTLTVASG
jgi:hypothetical protein